MDSITSEKPILVTGASGYVASWIIYKLLEQGHTVRGTVRDLSNTSKFDHLIEAADALPGAFEPHEADLLSEGSFDAAMQGCEIVIHTASPFKTFGVKNPTDELIRPALKGTKNVLESVDKVQTVKRVVLTASVVSIYGDAIDIEKTKDRTFTENDWNSTSTATHQPYPYSKLVAEKEAWKIAERQDRWSLVTIHPGFVLGPSKTSRTDSTSIDFMKGMIEGKMKAGVPELFFAVVDVRDVADAHIAAAFNPKAKGRYITVAGTMGMLDIAKSLQKATDQELPLPNSYLSKALVYAFGPLQGLKWKYIRNNVGIPIRFDNSRSKEDLGISYIPMDQTLKDHAQQILDQKA